MIRNDRTKRKNDRWEHRRSACTPACDSDSVSVVVERFGWCIRSAHRHRPSDRFTHASSFSVVEVDEGQCRPPHDVALTADLTFQQDMCIKRLAFTSS